MVFKPSWENDHEQCLYLRISLDLMFIVKISMQGPLLSMFSDAILVVFRVSMQNIQVFPMSTVIPLIQHASRALYSLSVINHSGMIIFKHTPYLIRRRNNILRLHQ